MRSHNQPKAARPTGNQAVRYLLAGYTCSQAMVMAHAREFGLDEETAARMAAGFAGGLAQGKTCGAIAGAVMVAGLAFGSGSPRDSYAGDLCTLATQELCRQFRRRHRSIECRKILKYHHVDFDDPAQMKGLRASGLCSGVVRDAQSILRRLLEERPF